jgi:hypothetical protein
LGMESVFKEAITADSVIAICAASLTCSAFRLEKEVMTQTTYLKSTVFLLENKISKLILVFCAWVYTVSTHMYKKGIQSTNILS